METMVFEVAEQKKEIEDQKQEVLQTVNDTEGERKAFENALRAEY